jgi:hypothetical protein
LNGQTVPVSGQQTFQITGESNFTFNCLGYNSGNVSKTITVRPNQSLSNLPTVNIYINPTSAVVNTYATLYWTSTNAYSCNLNGQTISPSGSQQIYVTSNQTSYIISCSNQYGQTVSSTVYSNPGQSSSNGLTSAYIYANTTNVSSGQAVSLNWSSTNAASCTVSGGASSFYGTSGTQTVYPTQTTQYTVTCSGLTGGPQVTNQVTVFVNGGVQDIAGPTSINIGQSGTWSVSSWNGGCVSVNWGDGTYNPAVCDGNATFTHTFANSGTYTITMSNSGVSKTLVVTVSSNTSGITATLIANPTTVASGQTVTLTWTSTNANYCNLLDPNGNAILSNQATSGNHNISPTASGNYQVKCFSASSNNSSYAYITVTGTNSGVVTVTANPTSITSGQTATISWNATNVIANSCVVKANGSTLVANQGAIASFSVNPTTTTTYTVQCNITSDGAQIVQNTVTVTVNGSGTLTFTANPTTVNAGQASTLTWSTGNSSYYCNISMNGSNFLTNQAWSGSTTVYPSVNTNYYITCYPTGGSGLQTLTQTLTVNTNGSNNGNVTVNIYANPATVAAGQPTVLTWTSTNANYCTISANNSTIATNQSPNASMTVYPSMNTNYVINCYNNNGQNNSAYVYVTTNGNTGVTPTANIYSTSQNVSSGQSITLNWYSTNANSCNLLGNGNLIISNQSPSQTYLVYPTQTTNYQITCTNTTSGQSASAYVYVTVNGSTNGGGNISLLSKLNGYVVISVGNACFSGRIDWGDNTSSTLNSCNAGQNTYSHQYAYINATQSYLIRLIDSGNSVISTTSVNPYN